MLRGGAAGGYAAGMTTNSADEARRRGPRVSEVLAELAAAGEAEWDPALSAVIRWSAHGSYSALDEPFQKTLTATVADFFHPHGLSAYLAGKGHRRVAKERAYDIWEVNCVAGGFDLVTVPTDTESVGFDATWEEAVNRIAAAEQWYVNVSATIMIPEALRDACRPDTES